MTDTPKACGCTTQGNIIYNTCDVHMKHEKKVVKVTAMIILTRIERLFKDTHLRELEEVVVNEVKRFL